jgi:hypothetical protein
MVHRSSKPDDTRDSCGQSFQPDSNANSHLAG